MMTENDPQQQPYDTSTIEERISVFEARFTELTTRYAEFANVLQELDNRIEGHLKDGKEMLDIARDEQEEANRKKGIAGLFSKRNQGRINAKLIGAIERDFAILTDLQSLTARNLQLVNDTGEAVQRDVKELMESVVDTVQNFHEATANSLRFLGNDVEMLKQLIAKDLLQKQSDSDESAKQDK